MTDSKYRGRRLDASQLFAILDDLAGITELQRQPINEVELDYCNPVPLPPALIERTLESIRSMQATEVADLDASQLYPILDDLAGLTELQRQPINEVELDYCNPVPLPPALIDRTLESIRSMQVPEVEAAPRRWWSRPAAALPIAISVLLLAAAPIYFFWSGRNSTETLTFEHAIETVFDPTVPRNRRHSAYVHLAALIKRGISAIKKCAAEVPALEPDVNDAIAEITAMCEQPAAVTPGNAFPSGHHREILDTLEKGREGDQVLQKDAIVVFLEMERSGIEAMWRARTLDGRFLKEFLIQFPMIQKRLKR